VINEEGAAGRLNASGRFFVSAEYTVELHYPRLVLTQGRAPFDFEVAGQGGKFTYVYGMRKDELRLLPHDPTWEEDFRAEKGRIAERLGDPSARIEHVGSTSIPSVHAKPILDLAILCGAKGVGEVASALEALGYEFRGQFDEEVGHYYAVLERGRVRLCQAHIFIGETAEWRSTLTFRDVLRLNRELAREYDEYKLGLAETAADKRAYAEVKSRWVDGFMPKVLAAARAAGFDTESAE
jgi:GrpB-like predicted nucleotidyltransferase (UPF0157 family)